MSGEELSRYVGERVLIVWGKPDLAAQQIGILHRRDDGRYEVRAPGVDLPISTSFNAGEVVAVRVLGPD